MIRTSCKHYEKCDNDVFLCHRFDNDRFNKGVEQMTRCCRDCVYYSNKYDTRSKYTSRLQHRAEELMKDKQQTQLNKYIKSEG